MQSEIASNQIFKIANRLTTRAEKCNCLKLVYIQETCAQKLLFNYFGIAIKAWNLHRDIKFRWPRTRGLKSTRHLIQRTPEFPCLFMLDAKKRSRKHIINFIFISASCSFDKSIRSMIFTRHLLHRKFVGVVIKADCINLSLMTWIILINRCNRRLSGKPTVGE